jgi:hypothetical protein
MIKQAVMKQKLFYTFFSVDHLLFSSKSRSRVFYFIYCNISADDETAEILCKNKMEFSTKRFTEKQ